MWLWTSRPQAASTRFQNPDRAESAPNDDDDDDDDTDERMICELSNITVGRDSCDACTEKAGESFEDGCTRSREKIG